MKILKSNRPFKQKKARFWWFMTFTSLIAALIILMASDKMNLETTIGEARFFSFIAL